MGRPPAELPQGILTFLLTDIIEGPRRCGSVTAPPWAPRWPATRS
jgi:hypothetical protein